MPLPNGKHTVFAATRWTVVGKAASGNESEIKEATATLFTTYWAPLYRYVRRSGKSAPDAEDLVQGFFVQLIDGNTLQSVDRQQGRFRAFLLGSLKNYMANEWRRDHAQKRGGFAPHLSIDWTSAETGLMGELSDYQSPEQLFDRDWAVALLDKVLNDLAQANGKNDFKRWESYLSLSSDRLPYAKIAEEFGMTEGAARVTVHRLRKHYRRQLREEIRRTLKDDRMLENEIQALFSALS